MFNRLLIIPILFLLVTYSAMSQGNERYKRDSLKIRECPTYIIEPYHMQANREEQEKLKTIPFSSISIHDVRFDTSFIGVINSKKFLSAKGFRKIRFNDKTENILAGMLNNPGRYTFAPDTYNLLCFLKQFRITQEDSLPAEDKPMQLYKPTKLYTTANVEIEAFLVNNHTFYPVLRFDTTASSFDVEEKDCTVLSDVLHEFVKKIAAIDTAKILQRKAYAFNEIRNMYYQRFNKPIIKDSVLNKGVYTSYQEFISNNPSVREYEFNKEGILYIKTAENILVPTRQAFGFCDGNRIWLNVNKVFYPLIKVGDTFEFLSGVKLANHAGTRYRRVYIYRTPGMSMGESSALLAAAGALAILLNHYKVSPTFVYQLNPETGEVY